MGNHTQSV